MGGQAADTIPSQDGEAPATRSAKAATASRSGVVSGKPLWGNRPVWLTLLVFLIPLLLSNALQSLGQTGSSIIVGQLIGVDALAAISNFFPIFFFFASFGIGLSSASAVLIGQAYGARNTERMEAITGTTLLFIFLLALVVATAGTIFTRDLMLAIGTPATILDDSTNYAHILLFTLPILLVYIVYTTIVRGTGDSQTPFYFLFVGTGLNLALTPILIEGWIGLPRLGVLGAAVAQVCSNTATLVVFAGFLIWRDHPLKLRWRAMRLDPSIVRLLLQIGLPSGFQLVMISLSEIAVISFVNRFGAHATAAYGAVNQIVGYVQFPAISLGITASIFGAQAIGADQADRLRQVLRSAVTLNYIIGGVLIALCYLFAQTILSWFLTDPSTVEVAHSLLVITLWGYLLFGNNSVLSGMMRASGTVFWPTAISLFAIWAVEVPTAFALSQRIGLTVVWIGYPAAFVVGLTLQFGYYWFVWRRKRHRRLVG